MILLKRLLIVCLFLSPLILSAQDDIERRTVKGRKVFICSMSDRDTFQTAEAGCKHWVQQHLPAGYKYNSSNVTENGAVKCICKKQGEADNDQQGMIYGILVCPENAVPYSKNNDNNFNELVCICPEGYIGKGSVCEKDTCAYAQMDSAAMALAIMQKLEQFKNEENEAFKNDPAGKVYPPGEPPILSDNEISGFLQLGSKLKADSTPTYADWVWPIVYGHALERMIARRVEKDECLKQVIGYVKNSQQMKEQGSNPDFRGKGRLPATVEFDVTTGPEYEKKAKDPKKAHFIFIIYERLFTSDELTGTGTASPPPTGGGKPAKPKQPAGKPKKSPKPKSSTDGR